MKQRKVPLRKCIVTGEMKQKKELIRIVRSPEGVISIDVTGKTNGRGAYISNSEECFERAQATDILSKHLHTKVSPEIYDHLREASKQVRN